MNSIDLSSQNIDRLDEDGTIEFSSYLSGTDQEKNKKTHNKGIFNIIYGLTLLTHGAHKLNGASREIRLFQIDSRWSTTTKRWLWWVFSWCDVIVGQCSQVSRKTNIACCDLRILPTGIISMKVFPREGTVNGMRVVWFASHWWGWKMLQCYWGTENKKTFSFDYVADWMRPSRDWGSFVFFFVGWEIRLGCASNLRIERQDW